MQSIIIEIVESPAGQNDHVETAELVLLKAKIFAQYTLDSVAMGGETNVFFGNDQSQSSSLQAVGSSQDQQMGVRCPDWSICKNRLEVTGVEQPVRLWESQARHASIVRFR